MSSSMDSICFSIRSMCPPSFPHMSTLFRQRASSFGARFIAMSHVGACPRSDGKGKLVSFRAS